MQGVLRDLRHGVRVFGGSPAFSAVALVALGLGVAATTAIFSVVDAALLKPLPFRDPEHLLVIWEKNPAQNKFKLFVAPANFDAWRRQSHDFEGMAAIQELHVNLTAGPNGSIDPEEIPAELVSAELFPILGVQPVAGRAFRPEEDRPGHNGYALLSHRLWGRRFGADAGIVGKTIQLNGRNCTVLGVLPAGFSILHPETEVWLPLGLNPNNPRTAGMRGLDVIARLRPGVTVEQARAELDRIGAEMERSNPALDTGWRPSAFPLRQEIVGKARQALLVLMGAVGCLLLMACVNVANLLLARGAGRKKEIAIRSAVGASRARVMVQLLAENMVLALAGGALGLALARGGLAIVASLGSGSVPRLAEARLDARLFLFCLAVSAATGLIFGTVPALQVSATNLNSIMTEGGRGGTTGRRGRNVRSALIVVEVALSVVVLIGAGLLMRSFLRLRSTNPGFEARNVLTFRLLLGGRRNAAAERRIAFVGQVSEALGSLPGAVAVGGVNSLPLTGLGGGTSFLIDGRPSPPPDQRPLALFRSVTPSYFRTIRIPLVAGREFTPADTPESGRVVLVNRAFARRFWPGGNPLAGRITLVDYANGPTAEIVGVVGDVKPERLESEDWPTIYGVYPQFPFVTVTMVVRTAGEPMPLASAVQREISRLDPEQPVSDVRPMEDVVSRSLGGARFNAFLLTAFAAIAFVLAAVGIYGVVSYDVSERTHEIGLRMALGAQRANVLQLVLGHGSRLAGYGIAIGLAAAFGLTRLMSSMLYDVKATDATTFAAISLLLAGVAIIASYLPSRRAMSLDPVAALRHE